MVYADPLLGRTLAHYRLDRLLGRGGMARVYFGWDIRLHRPVAIKVMDERYRDNPAYTARFVREARAVASWNHPHISKVFFAGEEDGWPFFVMEYVHGLDLQQLLRRYTEKGELLPHADVLRIGRAVAEALDYAHHKGVIHRDVKPSNVIVEDDGRVVLTDFGLAMNVAQGTLGEVFGSPHYIAPEQARNSAEAVPQSDLYSLGVMLYEMLTGVLPFDDPSPTALALKHLTADPPSPRQINPALSPEVEAVLYRALAKRPEQRYRSGKALIDALQQALVPGAVQAQPAAAPTLPGQAEKTEPRQEGNGRPTLSRVGMTEMVNDYLSGQSTARSPGNGPPPTYAGPVGPYPTRPPAALAGGFRGWAVGCFILLLIASLAGGLALGYAYSRQRRPGLAVGQTATPTPTMTATEPAASETPPPPSPTVETPEASPTLGPTATWTLTPTPTGTATFTPTSTPRPTLDPNAEYHILFLRLRGDLYLLNLGETDFPLERLELRNARGSLQGEEWDLEELRPGACVAALELGRGESPEPGIVISIRGERCEPTGKPITRRTNNAFWNSTFEVYFSDELAGRCEGEVNVCEYGL